jgi:hypothetical protein
MKMEKNKIVPSITHKARPMVSHSQLKGKSIDYYNQQIINILKQNNMADYVLFDISMLQTFVEKEKKLTYPLQMRL